MTSYLHIFVRPNASKSGTSFKVSYNRTRNNELSWSGHSEFTIKLRGMGRRVCLLSKLEILAYQSAFHPAAGQSGRWRIWQVAFKDPNMLKHGKMRVRVQSRNRFRFWIWFVGNVAPVFQNQLMRMVAAFASQEPEAKETIGKLR